jgi:hypothetical protein
VRLYFFLIIERCDRSALSPVRPWLLSLLNQQVENFHRCLDVMLTASEGVHCQARMEVIEITSSRVAYFVCGSNNMKKTATTRSKTVTMTYSISRTEMIELGILGLGLSIAVTAGFVALLTWVS